MATPGFAHLSNGATVAAALLGISAEDLAPETWIHRLKRMIAG